MIVIARMGSRKFLPNVNMRAQNRAARKLPCNRLRKPSIKPTTGVGAGQSGCRRELVIRFGGQPAWQERS
jgi:hypothetical protein